MTRAKSFKRRALPVLVSETVDCERLRCTLALASCVARWQRAQQTDGAHGRPSADVERGSAVQYVSCRSCPEGRERAASMGNDNGRGGR